MKGSILAKRIGTAGRRVEALAVGFEVDDLPLGGEVAAVVLLEVELLLVVVG